MGAALNTLKAYLDAEVLKIGSALDKLECAALIETWYPMRAALDAFRGSALQSYSISGRSFSRKSMAEYEERLERFMAYFESGLSKS